MANADSGSATNTDVYLSGMLMVELFVQDVVLNSEWYFTTIVVFVIVCWFKNKSIVWNVSTYFYLFFW